MRKCLPYVLIALIFFPALACTSSSGTTIKVVKPKYHHRFFSRKNDKRVKRTRVVRVKN